MLILRENFHPYVRLRTIIACLIRSFAVAETDRHLSLSDRPTTKNALNSNQENALISWFELLNSCYTPPKAKDIEIAANRLLKMAGSERVVAPMYSYRLIRRLPPHIKLIPKHQRNLYEFKLSILELLAIGTTGLG